MKLDSSEWAQLNKDGLVYTIRRKQNKDDGSWFVIAKIDKSGYRYLNKSFKTKKSAENYLNAKVPQHSETLSNTILT